MRGNALSVLRGTGQSAGDRPEGQTVEDRG